MNIAWLHIKWNPNLQFDAISNEIKAFALTSYKILLLYQMLFKQQKARLIAFIDSIYKIFYYNFKMILWNVMFYTFFNPII